MSLKNRGRNNIRVKRRKLLLSCKSQDFLNRKDFDDVRIVCGVPMNNSVFLTSIELGKNG